MSSPACRATLLQHRWAEAKSPLTFLIYLKQFVTLPIASFPKFTGRKIGQRAEKRAKDANTRNFVSEWYSPDRTFR
jgi:hypothetical protein